MSLKNALTIGFCFETYKVLTLDVFVINESIDILSVLLPSVDFIL